MAILHLRGTSMARVLSPLVDLFLEYAFDLVVDETLRLWNELIDQVLVICNPLHHLTPGLIVWWPHRHPGIESTRSDHSLIQLQGMLLARGDDDHGMFGFGCYAVEPHEKT